MPYVYKTRCWRTCLCLDYCCLGLLQVLSSCLIYASDVVGVEKGSAQQFCFLQQVLFLHVFRMVTDRVVQAWLQLRRYHDLETTLYVLAPDWSSMRERQRRQEMLHERANFLLNGLSPHELPPGVHYLLTASIEACMTMFFQSCVPSCNQWPAVGWC